MNIIAETKRLLLRKLEASDAEQFYLLNADPEVLKYTGDRPFDSISEAERFLNNYTEYKVNGFGRWAVLTRTSQDFAGWCGLKLNEEGLVDLGFRFFRREWGKGYATESARASLEIGFNDFNIEEIIGRAAFANTASIRVLEKINMKFWKHGTCNGLPDTVYYRISKEQFIGLKESDYNS